MMRDCSSSGRPSTSWPIWPDVRGVCGRAFVRVGVSVSVRVRVRVRFRVRVRVRVRVARVRPRQLGVGSEERRAEVGRREGTRVVGVEAAEGLADEHVVGPYGGADVLHERRVCPAERARCGGGGARRLLGLRLGDLVELEERGEGEVVDAALVRRCSKARGVAWLGGVAPA